MMSMSAYQPGALTVDCLDGSEPCGLRQHIFIEVDFDGAPYLWGIIVGRHTAEYQRKLQLACDEYFEGVDGESAFILTPIVPPRKLYQSLDYLIVNGLKEEVEEMRRQEEADEAARREEGGLLNRG